MHIAPGAAAALLDDDWLYTDGLVRIALERRNKGNGQSVTATVKYRDTNSSFGGDYDQNVAFGTKDRSDLTLVPTAHFLVTNVRGSKFDFRMDYRYETNDSNDSTQDFDNHVVSARTVRKF